MTADCGIRGDVKKEMQSCWICVKYRSRPAKSCKAAEIETDLASDLQTFTQIYRLFTRAAFRRCFSAVSEKLIRFSPASEIRPGVVRKAESLEAFFCLTAVTLRLPVHTDKLGRGVEA